jgi:hypothetical protein
MKESGLETGPLVEQKRFRYFADNRFGGERIYPADYGSGRLSSMLPVKNASSLLGRTSTWVEETYPVLPVVGKSAAALKSSLGAQVYVSTVSGN